MALARRLRLVVAAFAVAAVAALLVVVAGAADIPALTGRVVDDAHVLSAITRANLEGKLADLESKSGIQLVVATVPSLGGDEIEPYANTLFRAWKLGEAKKNNGVLFLVAPKEHRVRIEVGYGLEGTLTDATSSVIIANAATPRFKAGDFDGGVTRAVEDIVTVLTTDSADWQKKPELRAETNASKANGLVSLLVFLFILFVFYRIVRGRGMGLLSFIVFSSGSGGSSFGGESSGGSSSDSFSGGGGSSGGGGASGDW